MNIYEKLQACRVKLQGEKMKKSGQNKFANYDYFELGDFLPKINELMQESKLCSFVSFTSELATLTIVNAEKPEETISFTSPMSTAALKGCHEVQNLGAVQTYLRRYLYTNAFEIVEHDALESVTGKPDAREPKVPLDGFTVRQLEDEIQKKGKDLSKILAHYKVSKLNELTTEQAKELKSKLAS